MNTRNLNRALRKMTKSAGTQKKRPFVRACTKVNKHIFKLSLKDLQKQIINIWNQYKTLAQNVDPFIGKYNQRKDK